MYRPLKLKMSKCTSSSGLTFRDIDGEAAPLFMELCLQQRQISLIEACRGILKTLGWSFARACSRLKLKPPSRACHSLISSIVCSDVTVQVELVNSNACSDLPRKTCVSHGMIVMLMSVAVVAIMILSTCDVQIGQESHAGCMNEP